MSNIAILPVKSDSKRIPMKLFKEFCGKPLWTYVSSQVRDCTMIDEIYITSPDIWFKNIFSEGKRIKFIDRPKELAGDVELTEVMKHACKEVAQQGDNIIQIQLNKPLTKASDIMECIKVFEDGNYDSLSTKQKIKTGIIGNYVESSRTKNDSAYKSQAICKIWKYDILMNSNNQYSYGDNHCYLEIPAYHQEIDDMEDWRMAEALYKAGF